MTDSDSSPWNSLEVAKLAVSALTPIVVLLAGNAIKNSIDNAERSAELRSEVYKSIGGDLNDIYAYISFVGGWKELSPIEIVERKRAVDKAMHTYRPFFSAELFATYNDFMAEAFRTNRGAGTDAKIRSDISTPSGDRRVHSLTWHPSWEDRFTNERNQQAQRDAYDRFLQQLARDLHLQ